VNLQQFGKGRFFHCALRPHQTCSSLKAANNSLSLQRQFLNHERMCHTSILFVGLECRQPACCLRTNCTWFLTALPFLTFDEIVWISSWKFWIFPRKVCDLIQTVLCFFLNRISYCSASSSFGTVVAWIYRHEAKYKRVVLRCHAACLKTSKKAQDLVRRIFPKNGWE